MDVANGNMQMMAGMLSSVIFMTGTFPMLVKAFRTKDLRSYSAVHLTLTNMGNAVHWLYISSLPFGPIYILHSFFTVTSAMMLLWYLRYEVQWCIARLQGQVNRFFRANVSSVASCDPR